MLPFFTGRRGQALPALSRLPHAPTWHGGLTAPYLPCHAALPCPFNLRLFPVWKVPRCLLPDYTLACLSAPIIPRGHYAKLLFCYPWPLTAVAHGQVAVLYSVIRGTDTCHLSKDMGMGVGGRTLLGWTAGGRRHLPRHWTFQHAHTIRDTLSAGRGRRLEYRLVDSLPSLLPRNRYYWMRRNGTTACRYHTLFFSFRCSVKTLALTCLQLAPFLPMQFQ